MPSHYSYDNDTVELNTCIAFEFCKKELIQTVYAWTDQSRFDFLLNNSYKGEYIKIVMYEGKCLVSHVPTIYLYNGRDAYFPLQYE